MQEYAYITGAASGIGREVARHLTKKSIQVFLVDMNEHGLNELASELGAPSAIVDVTDWTSQERGFRSAVAQFGRIDYLFPIAGIGQKAWIPEALESDAGPFVKPELGVMDVNATALLWTVALGIQQFRRQGVGANGFRGKSKATNSKMYNVAKADGRSVLCPGSVCGIYPFPSSPLYAMSKHAVSGLVRSMGVVLPKEKITMNAFCPSPIRTAFSTDAFYTQLENDGLLAPMASVLDAVDKILGDADISGQLLEIGPNYANGQGHVSPKFPSYVDADMERVFAVLDARGPPR